MTLQGPQTPNGEYIHASKYRQEGETFRESMNRVASALADDPAHYKAFRDIIMDMRFLPAGRVQSSIGAARSTTAFNCYVSGTIADSISCDDGIMDRAKEAAITMRLGGGIGYDFSTIRPRGDMIRSLDSQASGPVSFMGVFDAVCKTIASSGHRRGAQMGVLRVDHPDIEEFIRAKHNSTQLTGFNVSIAVTDKFMQAVQDDGDFELKFGGRVYSTIKARPLWETIMRSTWDWAEPGVLFIDRINQHNNLYYCENIAATNPCVPGDTPILTDKGYLPIIERIGVPTSVWNGSGWSVVTPEKTGDNQPLLAVQLSDGSELVCTTVHKFVLQNDLARVSAEDLNSGDILLEDSWPVIQASNKDNAFGMWERGFFAGDGWVGKDGCRWIGLYGSKLQLESNFSGSVSREYEAKGGWTKTCHVRKFVRYGKNCTWDKTYVPGVEETVISRLEWLAGLSDSDGHATKDGSLQLSSKHRGFLYNVKLMITTLGERAQLSPMKEFWRLSLSASQVQRLKNLGFFCRRLDISYIPQREAARFLRVVSVLPAGTAEAVYCFTEPLRHMGVFNGVLTGQCGEQPLPPYGACLLGSFNLAHYSRGPTFDFGLFKSDIAPVVAAMDNVVDRTIYPLPEQKREAENKRRMGLGVTGLATAAAKYGWDYGSKEFLMFENEVLSMLRDEAYRASALRAKVKGAFPAFDKEKYLDGMFVSHLPKDIQDLIGTHGIRNSHLTSIAPTGTISMAADNVSSGIEPVFAHEVTRTIQTFDGPKTVTIQDYGLARQWRTGKAAKDVTAKEHLDVLLTAQMYSDSGVSKTCNVPIDMPWDDFKDVYMAAWKGGAKGLTTFQMGGKRMAMMTDTNDEKKTESCVINPETGEKDCG